MSAINPTSRRFTSRELAERHGCSIRTVQRLVGRPRDWWTQERRELRQKAARLRDTGMTWKQVGEALGMSENAARAAGKRARGEWASGNPQADRDNLTPDLFYEK